VFEEMLTRSVQDPLVGGHVAGTMSNVGSCALGAPLTPGSLPLAPRLPGSVQLRAGRHTGKHLR
jgi:hypothetical protein